MLIREDIQKIYTLCNVADYIHKKKLVYEKKTKAQMENYVFVNYQWLFNFSTINCMLIHFTYNLTLL